MFIRQVVGRPFIVPESLWVPPSRYDAEGPLIVAAQSCLTGLDTFYWFCTDKATVLDANGMPLADLPVSHKGGEVKFPLPEAALYVCLEARR